MLATLFRAGITGGRSPGGQLLFGCIQPGKRGLVVREGGAAAPKRRFGLLTLAEHAVSADQAKPAFQVIRVFIEAGGQFRHHAADHRLPLLGRQPGRRLHIRRARSALRRRAAFEPGKLGLDARPPGRILRRARQKRLPACRGGLLPAVLDLGDAQIILRARLVRIEFGSSVEGLARSGRDEAVGGQNLGLAHGREPFRRFAVQRDYPPPGIRRIGMAAEAQIGWRKHFPAARIRRVLLQMLLDAQHQRLQRQFAGRFGNPRKEGLIRHAWRTAAQIKAKRQRGDGKHDRQRHEFAHARGGGLRRLRCAFCRLCVVGGGNQTPGDLKPGGFGLGRFDYAAFEVASDLRKLVAVEGKLAGVLSSRRLFAAERTHDGGDHRARHGGKSDPEQKIADVLGQDGSFSRNCGVRAYHRRAPV